MKFKVIIFKIECCSCGGTAHYEKLVDLDELMETRTISFPRRATKCVCGSYNFLAVDLQVRDYKGESQ